MKKLIILIHFGLVLVFGMIVATPVETMAAETKIKIVLVGDSTVTDDAGWGVLQDPFWKRFTEYLRSKPRIFGEVKRIFQCDTLLLPQ